MGNTIFTLGSQKQKLLTQLHTLYRATRNVREIYRVMYNFLHKTHPRPRPTVRCRFTSFLANQQPNECSRFYWILNITFTHYPAKRDSYKKRNVTSIITFRLYFKYCVFSQMNSWMIIFRFLGQGKELVLQCSTTPWWLQSIYKLKNKKSTQCEICTLNVITRSVFKV